MAAAEHNDGPEASGDDARLTHDRQRSGMRNAIGNQIFGMLSWVVMEQGIGLLYLVALGVPDGRILIYLSLLSFLFPLQVFVAHAADRFGLKRIGWLGGLVWSGGFALFASSGFAHGGVLAEALAATGIAVTGLGHVIFSSSWFALLNQVVPGDQRGRFFGRLRFCWQTVGALFVAGAAALLGHDAAVGQYQLLFAVAWLGTVLRLCFYARIPERPRSDAQTATEQTIGVRRAIGAALRAPNYLPFCSYLFLISLVSVAAPMLFGLIEKRVLDLSDGSVALLANLMIVGMIAGFALFGRVIDRFGTKPIFLGCHAGYALIMAAFALRGLSDNALPYLGALHFGFGVTAAALSIAGTTELLALLPPQHQSVGASVGTSLWKLGHALSAGIAALLLHSGMLAEDWQLLGTTATAYDSLLLGCALLTVLFVVVLGLIPSVLKPHMHLPGSH